MKKLMLAASAAAMASGAFAAMPAVYDYKASVKHIYLKEVNVTIQNWLGQRQTVKVYQKYQKAASLKGYLIHDANGATSKYASLYRSGLGYTAANAAFFGPRLVAGGAGTVTDQMNNRAFLVVQNSSAEAAVRSPKILPAVFETKFFDTKYKIDWANGVPNYTAGVSEGTLFVGGDLIAGSRPYLYSDRTEAQIPPAGDYVALNAYGDYGWTSIYLFGKYNSANGSAEHAASQAIIDATQKIPAATAIYFHDTWMNGAGIGKYTTQNTPGEDCCGFQTVGGVAFALDSLAGNLKGGLFLCSENGRTVVGYARLGGFGWEDQFNNERYWGPTPAAIAAPFWAVGDTGDVVNGTYNASQDDVWVDGEVEQNTTDVLYGTWSIKRIAAARIPARVALTFDELDYLVGGVGGLAGSAGKTWKCNARCTGAAGRVPAAVPAVGAPNRNNDLEDLNATIKGCAIALKRDVKFIDANNASIPAGIAAAGSQAARQDVPFISYDFAQAYGLNQYVAE